MKFLAVASVIASASAFTTPWVTQSSRSSSSLTMVLEKPRTAKKISKLETLKVESSNLLQPLKDVRTIDTMIGI
jgi:hypothetical protein